MTRSLLLLMVSLWGSWIEKGKLLLQRLMKPSEQPPTSAEYSSQTKWLVISLEREPKSFRRSMICSRIFWSRGLVVGNYATVLKGDKFGLIDRAGKVIIPFQYTNMGDVGTLIAVQKGGKWGYVDLTNKMLIQPTYEYAETFVDGLGIVELLTLQGAINAKGQVVIPLEHTEVKRLDKGHYLVSRGSKYGVYSDKGELLVPMEYGQIRKVQGDFLLLSKGAEMHYLYLPENRLIQPKIQ